MIVEEPWIIINPHSGGGRALEQKKLIKDKAVEMGWQGKYVETTPKKNGRMWAEEAIRAGVKQIIIGGGDGTIREVLESAVKAKLTLGIIPLGTGNVLARNLDIPLDTEKALRVALHGKIKKIDMGEANGNYFGVISGMGVDVDVMENTNKAMKGRWGILAYVWTGLQALAKSRKKYRVIIDNKKNYIFRAKSIAVANMARTVAGIEVAQGAGPHSSDLKVVVIRARDIGSWVDLLINALKGEVNKSPYYKLLKAQKVEIYPLGKPRKFECDGDEFPPTSKLEVVIHPRALRVRVPAVNMGSRMVGNKRKIIIFDFDGTLADTLQKMIKVFNSLADRYSFPQVDKKRVQELRGQSAREVVKVLGIGNFQLVRLLAEGRKEFVLQQKEPNIFPGIKAALLKLKSKYGLGIVTSNEGQNVNAFLKKYDLQIFDFIYSDRSIFGKGIILKHLIQKYGFESEQVIYVGDEVRDIEAARESKIKVASVAWGFNTKEILLKHKPDWWISKPIDLTRIEF